MPSSGILIASETDTKCMNNSDLFSKKLTELQGDELQYTEEYFAREYGHQRDTESADLIRESAVTHPHHSISPSYSSKHVDDTWLDAPADDFSGELAVDVFQTENDVVIVSTVAGVRSEDLDIDMNGDMITIRGKRKPTFRDVSDDQFLVRECYWGGFSRSIILPADILYDRVKATLENGILTIILPKSPHSKTGKIPIEER
jgi:HSP20 family protein